MPLSPSELSPLDDADAETLDSLKRSHEMDLLHVVENAERAISAEYKSAIRELKQERDELLAELRAMQEGGVVSEAEHQALVDAKEKITSLQRRVKHLEDEVCSAAYTLNRHPHLVPPFHGRYIGSDPLVVFR